MQAVIGYIYLLAIPDAAFHESTNRMYAFNPGYLPPGKDGTFPPPPAEKRKLIACRWGYRMAALTDWPLDRPDAYIFTKEAVKESGLRVVRTYRLVNPAIDDPTEPRAASPPLPAG